MSASFNGLAGGGIIATMAASPQLFAGEAPIISDSAVALETIEKWTLCALTATGIRRFSFATGLPSGVVSSDKVSLANGETAAITVTFESRATGLVTGDFTLTGGALSALAPVAATGGRVWTATFTASAAVPSVLAAVVLKTTGVAYTGVNDDGRLAVVSASPVTIVAGKPVGYYPAGKFNFEVVKLPADLTGADKLPALKALVQGTMLHFGHLI